MTNKETHPYTVVVSVNGTVVRAFPGYATELDAQTYADHLKAQAARNGWAGYKFRVTDDRQLINPKAYRMKP